MKREHGDEAVNGHEPWDPQACLAGVGALLPTARGGDALF